MLQQPDRDKFIEAMEAEVASIYDEGIWKKVPRSVILDHYRKGRNKDLDIRRHQTMMIWSFKRKRKPDGTITKYKACYAVMGSTGMASNLLGYLFSSGVLILSKNSNDLG